MSSNLVADEGSGSDVPVAKLVEFPIPGTIIGEVFTEEIYGRVRLDRDPEFVSWARPDSAYNPFFLRCLEAKNPYAVYAESLRLAFCCGLLSESLKLAAEVKNISSVATLLFIILNHCAHIPWSVEEEEFGKKYRRVREIQRMGEELKKQIQSLNPKRKNSYGKGQWYCRAETYCWEEHAMVEKILDGFRKSEIEPETEISQEFKGDRCSDCIVYHLSREICLLS